ncbi:MAG: hypothetical protein MJA84_13680 [Firmicutes bacterium]|nr:hypothetical protein [Bacillota bacterium]
MNIFRKKRVLLTAFLAMVFCLTAVFSIGAAQQPTAKDLVLAAIKNFNIGVDKGFYENSKSETNLEVTKFGGSLQEEYGDYSGDTVKLIAELDDSSTLKLSYDTDIKGVVADGDIYLTEDKIIFTKDLFYLLQELGFDLFENSPTSLAEAPEYLYMTEPQLKAVWEQMAFYQKQQLPAEYTELLLFMVEAIPDQYFNLSATKVTIQLDEDGLVDTVVSLLTKANNESERLAEIFVSMNQHNFEKMEVDPAEMKQEMASGLETMTVPTREEIQVITNFIEVKDFTYEHSLLPGGPKKFNLDIDFGHPNGSVDGAFNIVVDTLGKEGDLEGSYSVAGKYNSIEGPAVVVELDSEYSYAETVYHSDTIFNVTAKDNITGELMLDLGIVSDSVSEVDTGLKLKVPELNSNNSLDIIGLFSNSTMTENVQ